MRSTSYIVIELKTGRFKPEYAGQLNFYVNAIDDLLRSPDDGLTVGILLCASHNERVVRYALHTIRTPMAVAGYRYRDLPEDTAPDDDRPVRARLGRTHPGFRVTGPAAGQPAAGDPPPTEARSWGPCPGWP